MSTSYTPGPWKAETVHGWASDPVITAPSWFRPIAVLNDHPDRHYRMVEAVVRGETVSKFGPATEEGEARKAAVEAEKLANARLIAAAPELLEAAQVALNYIENTESELGITLRSGDMLRAAIAKTVQS